MRLAQLDPGSTGLPATASNAGYDVTQGNIAAVIGKIVIQPALGIMGLLFMCLTIYAGFLWMTAAGDSKKVDKAKDILRAAVVGAVITVSAYALSNFVINALSGISSAG